MATAQKKSLKEIKEKIEKFLFDSPNTHTAQQEILKTIFGKNMVTIDLSVSPDEKILKPVKPEKLPVNEFSHSTRLSIKELAILLKHEGVIAIDNMFPYVIKQNEDIKDDEYLLVHIAHGMINELIAKGYAKEIIEDATYEIVISDAERIINLKQILDKFRGTLENIAPKSKIT